MNTMTETKRADLMAQFATQAKEHDRRGDMPLRRQASDAWRELATDEEAARAPAHIWWTGRRGRPPVDDEDRAEPTTIRLSASRKAKLQQLGREWLERQIDRAKL